MKSNKGRPPQLTKQQVIECALKIGFAQISMHSLGKQLGVSATALYRHVSSKEELISMCSDYVIEKVALPSDEHWDKYLYAFADNFRQALLSFPGSVEFVRHSQAFTPASSILADHALGIFRLAKFEAEVGFMAFACVFTRVTDIVQHQEIASRNSELQKQQNHAPFDSQKLPNLAWLMRQTKPVDYDQYFADGIKITVEGLKSVYGKKS